MKYSALSGYENVMKKRIRKDKVGEALRQRLIREHMTERKRQNELTRIRMTKMRARRGLNRQNITDAERKRQNELSSIRMQEMRARRKQQSLKSTCCVVTSGYVEASASEDVKQNIRKENTSKAGEVSFENVKNTESEMNEIPMKLNILWTGGK